MIGVMDEREKTGKLWNGLHAPIQKQLWLFGLNPEVSTWNEMQQGAETIETSEKFTDPQHCRNNISGGSNLVVTMAAVALTVTVIVATALVEKASLNTIDLAPYSPGDL